MGRFFLKYYFLHDRKKFAWQAASVTTPLI
ncbi:MAG: hypothetical protein RL571_609 [Pseudomonadota bacterium]|jgi:hypothetical protein